MAGGDDLAAVWGPDGLATTDPTAIRSVVSAPSAVDEVGRTTPPPPPPPPVDQVSHLTASRGPSAKVVGAAAVVFVLGAFAVVLAVFSVGRTADGDGLRTAATSSRPTATTIVSAATDLLHTAADDAPAIDVASADAVPEMTAPTTTEAAGPDRTVRGADDAAAAFTMAMNGHDCDALWNLLSSRSRQFFEQAVSGQAESPSVLLCEALRDAPVIAVQGRARATGTDRAVVPIAAGSDVEDIAFVRERGDWKVDLLASRDAEAAPPRRPAATTPDAVKQSLEDASTAEGTIFVDDGRFTDDVGRLSDVEPALSWRPGMAPVAAEVGAVYVEVGDAEGSVVCLSVKADNGARFLVKRTADGTTTYAGGEIPAACDASPLRPSW